MPRFDKTGPSGQGPLTGGGFGECNPNGSRVASHYRGRRLGRGRAFGRGRGFYVSYARPSLEDEKSYLEARLKEINSQLED